MLIMYHIVPKNFFVTNLVSLTSFKLSASAFCSCVIEDFKLLFSSSNILSLSVFFLMSAARSPAKTWGLGERGELPFEICLSNHNRSLADWRMIDWSSSTFAFCWQKREQNIEIFDCIIRHTVISSIVITIIL